MTAIELRPPKGPIDSIISVPGSKSIANRALVCAMLATGSSSISGIPTGDDCEVVVRCIRDSGRLIEKTDDVLFIAQSAVLKFPGIVDAVLGGTSSRFLTAVAALFDSTSMIDGQEALRARPMADLHGALLSLGAQITHLGEPGHLPIAVSRGTLVGGHINIAGNVSSQFISALMLIGPLLEKGLLIHIDGPLVSRSYVEMTAHVMRSFGAEVELEESRITIVAGKYIGREYHVEPDYSSAAFPMVAIALREGTVTIAGIADAHLQGDSAIVSILELMGMTCHREGANLATSRDATTSLVPLNIDMSDCSDLVPAVAVACCVANGTSVISGVGFIRNKESDRLGDLADELTKAGATITVHDDGLTITGPTKWRSAVMGSHHDHRLAMAFSLLSLCHDNVKVDSPEVVTKSWPNYFADMSSILGLSETAN